MVQVKVYCNNIQGATNRAEWATTLPDASTKDIQSILLEAHSDLINQGLSPRNRDPMFRLLASVTTIENSDLNPVSI